MLHPVKYLVLHDSVLLGGKTFGPRVDPKITGGLAIKWEDEQQVLIMSYKNGDHPVATHYIPQTNALGWTIGEPEVVKIDPLAAQKAVVEDLNVRKKITAQASTPHGHVFDGLGAGKSK